MIKKNCTFDIIIELYLWYGDGSTSMIWCDAIIPLIWFYVLWWWYDYTSYMMFYMLWWWNSTSDWMMELYLMYDDNVLWWWNFTSHNLPGRKAFLLCSSTSFAGGRDTEMESFIIFSSLAFSSFCSSSSLFCWKVNAW